VLAAREAFLGDRDGGGPVVQESGGAVVERDAVAGAGEVQPQDISAARHFR
jgi:hypothetical protein